MATGIDRSKMPSMVIFSDVSPVYPFGDIECRFYVTSDLTCPEDKIGLFRIGWKQKSEYLAIKDMQSSQTDEFGEKRITFALNELKGKVNRDDKYQFCYFHWWVEKTSFEFCDASMVFGIHVPLNDLITPPIHQQQYINRNQQLTRNPELSISSNTIPKTLYDTNPSDPRYGNNLICTNDICMQNHKSLEYMVNEKDRELIELSGRLAQTDKIKTLQIESLKASYSFTQEKCVLLESELKQKIDDENRMEIMKSDLMDTIRLTEVKNSSMEEQLRINEDEKKGLMMQCSEQQELIDELQTKLTLVNSELDKYRSVQSRETLGHDTENKFLRDKLEELKIKCEKLKRVKESAQQEKIDANNQKTKLEVELQMTKENMAEIKSRASKADEARLKASAELKAKEILMKKHIDEMKTSYKTPNDVIIQARQHANADITIYANEMAQEMKDYAISHASKSLKLYNDVKSIALAIGNTFDEKYGQSWQCFVGENIVHTPFSYAPNTYLSFAIDSLNIVLFKTHHKLDYTNVISYAKKCGKVHNSFKTEWVDDEFHENIISIAELSLSKEFANYFELSQHLIRRVYEKYGEKYGNNWFAIVGDSQAFDSNYIMSNRRYMELYVGNLKIIVLQMDEVPNPQPRRNKQKM